MTSTWKMYSHPHSLRKLKLNLVKERPNQDQIDGHILLGHGISGYVIALDGNYVQKIFPSSGNPFMDEAKEKDRAIEIRIYKRLGDHPRVCKYIQDVKSGIVLKKQGKNLRIHLQDPQDGKPVGLHQAIEWSCQTAQGLAYIHSRKILHTDIECHNLLLDQHNNLKLCDFAGSSIDGEEPTVCCNVRYQPYTDDPTYPVTIRTELFALGSTLYEIWTGRKPYQDKSDEDVIRCFRDSQFPDVENLPPASVISKCWRGSYSNATEVVNDLAHLRAQLSREADTKTSSHLLRPHTQYLWNIAIFSTAVLTALLLSRRLSK